jgi:hypothetical protein
MSAREEGDRNIAAEEQLFIEMLRIRFVVDP